MRISSGLSGIVVALVVVLVVVPVVAFGFPTNTSIVSLPTQLQPVGNAAILALTPILMPQIADAQEVAATTTGTTSKTSSPTAHVAASPTHPHVTQPVDVDTAHPRYPVRLIIPSIGLDAPVDPVGLDASGNMAVPSGSTKDVGWYKGGALPGDVGSAVIDAHVFAGFAQLKYVSPGSDIYVVTEDGTKLHFVVSTTDTYALGALNPAELFGLNDARRLNLITCAGNLTPDHSTYDHRLVVYAVLAN